MSSPLPVRLLLASVLIGSGAPLLAQSTCSEEPPVLNHQGPGSTVCPCFVPGEEAGAVFQAPAAYYPIEILRVGIGWGSLFGGAPQSLEQAIRIRAGGLPVPGVVLGELQGPVLTDGFINEFDFEPLPGEVIVASGPFTVTLAFANGNVGTLGPTMVHDGNGCISGQNVVFEVGGTWLNVCSVGLAGDWLVTVVYRQTGCGPPDPEFVRGECNADTLVNIADAITLLGYLFPSGPQPTLACADACDTNDDSSLDIADAVALLAALFGTPSVPLPPPTACGTDPVPDALDCGVAAACP